MLRDRPSSLLIIWRLHYYEVKLPYILGLLFLLLLLLLSFLQTLVSIAPGYKFSNSLLSCCNFFVAGKEKIAGVGVRREDTKESEYRISN